MVEVTPGRGWVPAYKGRLRTEGVGFLGLRYMKGYKDFVLFKCMKGWQNLSFQSVKRPRGLKDAFFACEKVEKKNVLVLCFFHIIFKDSALTDVKRDAKF